VRRPPRSLRARKTSQQEAATRTIVNRVATAMDCEEVCGCAKRGATLAKEGAGTRAGAAGGVSAARCDSFPAGLEGSAIGGSAPVPAISKDGPSPTGSWLVARTW